MTHPMLRTLTPLTAWIEEGGEASVLRTLLPLLLMENVTKNLRSLPEKGKKADYLVSEICVYT